MKLLLIFAFLLSTVAFAEDKPAPRYQIVATPHGVHSVFRVDTTTGEVSYCFAINSSTDTKATTATGVYCVQQVK